jgi:hypothetical protein
VGVLVVGVLVGEGSAVEVPGPASSGAATVGR